LPEACPADEASLHSFASALIAEEDFYGALYAGVAARGRLTLPNGLWLSLWVPGLEYRFVANATVEADSTDLGAGALGVHVPIAFAEDMQLVPYSRLLVPTETIFINALRFGFEHGLALGWFPTSRFEAVFGGTFPLLVTVNHGRNQAVFLPSALADVAYKPFEFFTVLAGAAARVRSGRDGSLESLDPRLGARLYLWRGVRVELAAGFPIAGRDRTDVVLAATIGWVEPQRAPTAVVRSRVPGHRR
jgi:hypothetical protein